ncbi:hypothetical protein NLJ89_g557 [Agrocybe chaxingu]|uniref:F-box domain-containing protein n=1 Tax=Agrocybe chaxingu TaxID=84603 RepID=A0A9W8TEP8_9AGAR|nr:hypothetical protein NLJ89_g557 [Agrocybe chaxingu]
MACCYVCGEDSELNNGVRDPSTLPKDGRVCYSCLDLDNLQAQIRNTKSFLAHLESHVHTLKSKYNHTHDHFTHQFPPEIIARIFAFCVAGPQKVLEITPFTLAAVCRRWRHVVLNFPALWANVNIDLKRFETKFRRRQELLIQWLKRSGQVPLSIRMTYHEPADWSWCRGEFKNIINILSVYSHRWQDIDLNIPFHLLKHLCGNGGYISILRTLTINPPPNRREDQQPPVGTFSFWIPNGNVCPERVSFSGINFNAIHVHWRYTTEAEFRGIALDDALALLRAAPNLRTCTLDLLPGTVLTQNPIIAPSLNTLGISVDALESNWPFFEYVRLPVLRSATFRYTTQSFAPFATCLSQSGCNSSLTSLVLSGGDCSLDFMDEDGLYMLLAAAPALEALVLHMPLLPREFFEVMAVQQDLLSRLRKLRYGLGRLTFAWGSVC